MYSRNLLTEDTWMHKGGFCLKKIFILDTNVLIQEPGAFENLEDNLVVIPLIVVEELDGLKKADGEKGRNARTVVRLLEKYRNEGNLLEGVTLENGGILRVEQELSDVPLSSELQSDKADNRILQVCKAIEKQYTKQAVVLVTKDLILRLKAQILGICAEDFTTQQVTREDEYTGRCKVFIPNDLIKEFKKNGIAKSKVYLVNEAGKKKKAELVENEFVILQSDTSLKKTVLGRVCKDRIVPLKYKKKKPYGIEPRNVGQYFLQEALMADVEEAPLVIVQGIAGTAKTFYSVAVGLEKVYNNPTNEYRRIMICRPNAQFDDDIGYLPGDEQDKIAPLMRPIIDNFEQLLDSDEEERYDDEKELADKIAEIFERGIIQTEALNFIRGRSIVNTYLIIDEAQNMTPNQVKGIITRAGKGTKIILLGDPNQIDRPFLDEKTNGLSYAAKHMKGSSFCWQISLSAKECERSQLAMDAATRL